MPIVFSVTVVFIFSPQALLFIIFGILICLLIDLMGLEAFSGKIWEENRDHLVGTETFHKPRELRGSGIGNLLFKHLLVRKRLWCFP